MSKVYKFPKNFIWGTATAAHQIEGNNVNSDWWAWENSSKNSDLHIEPSGIACDSYNRYKEDFDLCKKLNNNAVRISIEWARIEPKEGKFVKEEFEHYRQVLRYAKEKGLKTFVTLHHFTNPNWFFKKGGWVNLNAPKYFARYARVCAEELGDLVDVYLTINEPQVYALMSYIKGEWLPEKKNFILAFITQVTMMIAHLKAYTQIKLVRDVPVGLVKHIVWYEAVHEKYFFKPIDKLIAGFIYWMNDGMYISPIRHKLDLLGVNYYFTQRIKYLKIKNPDALVSDLNWWINPEGLELILLNLKKYGLPLYITENGVADSEDRVRKDVLQEMLIACSKAIEKAAPLKGYFHWSLIDNYEWHRGFWPRFGLVDIDRTKNLERKPRKSFYYYAKICKENIITTL